MAAAAAKSTGRLMTSSAPILDIENGVKRLGGTVALALPHLSLTRGSRTLVAGRNGTGKSTLLRVVAGLNRLDSGTWRPGPDFASLQIGYLPQTGGIWRDLTIEENADALQGIAGQGMTRSDQLELSERLGLEPHASKKAGALSGGFQRLAAIFCLLTTSANALVLDEPSSGLDVERRTLLYDVLAGSSARCAFVLVTEHESAPGLMPGYEYFTQHIILERPAAEESII